MNIDQMVKALKVLRAQHGNVDVFFQDPNSSGGPYLVTALQVHTAKPKEFPKDWNMPAGYKYALQSN